LNFYAGALLSGPCVSRPTSPIKGTRLGGDRLRSSLVSSTHQECGSSMCQRLLLASLISEDGPKRLQKPFLSIVSSSSGSGSGSAAFSGSSFPSLLPLALGANSTLSSWPTTSAQKANEPALHLPLQTRLVVMQVILKDKAGLRGTLIWLVRKLFVMWIPWLTGKITKQIGFPAILAQCVY
jgi:hypothetical protein